MFAEFMYVIYSMVSALLLFWHAAWEDLLRGAEALGTDWSWVLGIVLVVVTVRAALFPLIVRQTRSQRALQALQPRVRELRDAYGADRVGLQRELTELHRSAKVSPLAGLLPALVQAPVLLGLLHVLRHLRPGVTGEAARTLYGWTLTQFDGAAHATLFGAPLAASIQSAVGQVPAGGTPVLLVAAGLVAVMVVSAWLTSRQLLRRAGWAQDPHQRAVQRLMLYGTPLTLLVSGAVFPIGVLLYWSTQNLIALAQQTWILRRYPPSTA